MFGQTCFKVGVSQGPGFSEASRRVQAAQIEVEQQADLVQFLGNTVTLPGSLQAKAEVAVKLEVEEQEWDQEWPLLSEEPEQDAAKVEEVEEQEEGHGWEREWTVLPEEPEQDAVKVESCSRSHRPASAACSTVFEIIPNSNTALQAIF